MSDEIERIIPAKSPFDPDINIFNLVDQETGEIIGEPYSFNDWITKFEDISCVNHDLLGPATHKEGLSCEL